MRRLRASLEAHLGSRDVARVIYGAVIGLALVAAMEAHPPGTGQSAALIIATAVAVAFAEAFSEAIAEEARTRRHADRARVKVLAADSGAVFFGAAFPAIFFLLALAGVMDQDTAFTLSKWSGAGLIFCYGFLAARLAGSGVIDAVLHGLAVGLIGVGLIAVKAVLH